MASLKKAPLIVTAISNGRYPCRISTIHYVRMFLTLLVTLLPRAVAVGGEKRAPSIMFYHADHLGSTNITTNENGDLRTDTAYYPFGTMRYEHAEGLPSDSDPTYRFSSKERDDESGLQYFEARYYFSEIGRFVSYDGWAKHVETTGAYAYAINNPLKYVDPLGTDPTHQSSDRSFGDQTESDFKAVGKHTARAVPATMKKAHVGATASAGSKLNKIKFENPDNPGQANDAGGEILADAGKVGGKAGGEKLWDEIDQHWSWAVKAPLIGIGAGLVYGLALIDIDLPVPLPSIPVRVGSSTVEFSPEIDMEPITTEVEGQEQYAPSIAMGVTLKQGRFSQTLKGGYNPGTGYGSVNYTLGVKTPIGGVGISIGGSGDKGFTSSATLKVPY